MRRFGFLLQEWNKGIYEFLVCPYPLTEQMVLSLSKSLNIDHYFLTIRDEDCIFDMYIVYSIRSNDNNSMSKYTTQ